MRVFFWLVFSAHNAVASSAPLPSLFRPSVVKVEQPDAARSQAIPFRHAASLRGGEDAAVSGATYDLVVVGGGSGGLACAQEAARLGARVACLDYVVPSPHGTRWGLGGTCVNVGCIPKKLMHQAALLGGYLGDAKHFGWPAAAAPTTAAAAETATAAAKGGDADAGGSRGHEWAALVAAVNRHIRSLNFKYRAALGTAGIEYLNLMGALDGQGGVVATDPKSGKTLRLEAKNVVLAVGGRPRPLSCPGGDLAISSDDIFTLNRPPGKTLVVGAGYVALECAGFLQALGHPTTVMFRSIVLRGKGFDRDCALRIRRYMELEGISFLGPAVPERIELVESSGSDGGGSSGGGGGGGGGDSGSLDAERGSSGGGTSGSSSCAGSTAGSSGGTTAGGSGGKPSAAPRLRVWWRDDASQQLVSEDFDTVLAATGRDPQTGKLGLEAAGVETVPDGKVLCRRDESTAPGVYAIGDAVSGAPELTPVAVRAGQLLARRLFGGASKGIDYDCIPTTVFTQLEYSCCGLSEEEAIAKLGEKRVEVYHATFTPLEWQLNDRWPRNACYIKAVVDLQDSGRIVGLHFLGPGAGEVMQGFALAMQLGATYKDLRRLIGIHPTTAEELTHLSVTKRSGQSIERGGC